MIHKISYQAITAVTSESFSHISNRNRDEMAIPSYLHGNLLIRWLMWQRYEVIAHLADLNKNTTALEFGCGIGLFLPEIDKTCKKGFAIDLFPEYAQILCRELNLDITFLNNLSEINDNSVDIIVAADVLEHIEDNKLHPLLQTFNKKLTPNGRLIISGPTENFAYKIGRIIAGLQDKGDYHLTNVNYLIDIIGTYFRLKRTETLPFRFPPHLFKICQFSKER